MIKIELNIKHLYHRLREKDICSFYTICCVDGIFGHFHFFGRGGYEGNYAQSFAEAERQSASRLS